jgi:hypothetical protein
MLTRGCEVWWKEREKGVVWEATSAAGKGGWGRYESEVVGVVLQVL